MARQSIDDGSAPSASKSAPGGENNTLKVAFAIGAIVVAAVLLAWNFGAFSGPPKVNGKPLNKEGDTLSPEDQKLIDEQKKLQALPKTNPRAPKGG